MTAIAGPHRFDPQECDACLNAPAPDGEVVTHTDWNDEGRLVSVDEKGVGMATKQESVAQANGGGSSRMLEGSYAILPPDRLIPAPDNPRSDLGDLSGLAESIKAQGILEPLVVTPQGDDYMIVIGHRRHAAAVEAQILGVPCIIRDYDEKGRLEAMLVENLQREHISPIEEARTYRRLVDLGYKQAQLADRVGFTQAYVSRRINLLELPEDIQQEIYTGGISLADAHALLPLRKHPERIKKALDSVTGYQSLSCTIQAQLKELKAELEQQKRIDELKAAGVPFVAYDVYEADDEGPSAAAEVEDLGVDLEAHRTEPCHAFTATPADRWPRLAVLEICTDPARHEADGASELKVPRRVAGVAPVHREPGAERPAGSDAEEPEAPTLRDYLAEAQERRTAFISDELLAKKMPSSSDALDMFVLAVTDPTAGYQEINTISICSLLNLEPGEPRGSVDEDEYAAAMGAFAAESSGHAIRVALAVSIDLLEAQLPGCSYKDDHSAPSWRYFVPYFELLQKFGYELSDVERAQLEKSDEPNEGAEAV